MRKKTLFLKLITSLTIFVYSTQGKAVEFNQQALSISGTTDIDLSAFEASNYGEGKYFANIVD